MRLIMLVVGLIVGLSAGCAMSLRYFDGWMPQPKSTLTERKGRMSYEEASELFDRRVKAAFPIGSSETAMGIELRSQGFGRQDWGSSPGTEHLAVRRDDDFTCNQAYSIVWRSDVDGKLTEIHGSYRAEACL